MWSSGPSLPAGKQESVEIHLDAQRWLPFGKKFVVLPFFCSYKYHKIENYFIFELVP